MIEPRWARKAQSWSMNVHAVREDGTALCNSKMTLNTDNTRTRKQISDDTYLMACLSCDRKLAKLRRLGLVDPEPAAAPAPEPAAEPAPARPVVLVRQQYGEPLVKAEVWEDEPGRNVVRVVYVASRTSARVARARIINPAALVAIADLGGSATDDQVDALLDSRGEQVRSAEWIAAKNAGLVSVAGTSVQGGDGLFRPASSWTLTEAGWAAIDRTPAPARPCEGGQWCRCPQSTPCPVPAPVHQPVSGYEGGGTYGWDCPPPCPAHGTDYPDADRAEAAALEHAAETAPDADPLRWIDDTVAQLSEAELLQVRDALDAADAADAAEAAPTVAYLDSPQAARAAELRRIEIGTAPLAETIRPGGIDTMRQSFDDRDLGELHRHEASLAGEFDDDTLDRLRTLHEPA